MTLVERLLELHQMWVEYINEVGKVPTDEEIKEIETIKKQLEENEEKAKKYDDLYLKHDDLLYKHEYILDELDETSKELKALHQNQRTQTDIENQKTVEKFKGALASLKSNQNCTLTLPVRYVAELIERLLENKK